MAADPTGDWRVADGVANIRVAQCNGSMWGVVAWEKTPGGRGARTIRMPRQAEPADAGHADPDRHEEEAWRRCDGRAKSHNAKDGQFYSSTIKPIGSDQLEMQGCVLGFSAAVRPGRASPAPIPSSPANSMAKGARQRPPARKPRTAASPTTGAAAPKTTGSVNPAPKTARSEVSPADQRRRHLPHSLISRGLPISAGWNNSTAASVVTSESAKQLAHARGAG